MVALRQRIRHLWERFNTSFGTVSSALADETLIQLPFFPYDDSYLAGYILPLKPDTLCESCWEGAFGANAVSMFDVTYGSQETKSYSYVTSWDYIVSHAETGCAWCGFLKTEGFDFPLSEWKGPVDIDIGLELCFDGAPPGGLHMLYIYFEGMYGGCYGYTLNDGHPAAPHTRSHAPVLDVGSARAFQLARGLGHSCKNEHERCRNIIISREEAVLPTRLIDCTDPDRPRLVKSSEGQHSQYITLSYVWGGDQPHKTTRSNLSQYERGLDLALLPQTIRDAIRVTHEFGFKLLWVDSLCIVQDADDDKQLEIGRMHHIYRYASLTIVAASAHNVMEGFLHNCKPCAKRACLPILSPPTRDTMPLQLRTLTLYSKFAFPTGFEYSREPISKRAWCLQEYLMSPRSLLFTSYALQFRCQTATRSIGTSFYDWTSEPRLPDALFLKTPSPPKDGIADWNDLLYTWKLIINDYTRRSVTILSDKLVACAAIAEAFHRVLDTDYLAGLWSHSLLTDLLWITSTMVGSRRHETLRAPSWSWASVDGRVDTRAVYSHRSSIQISVVAQVVQCKVSLKDPAQPFGEVTGGSLILRGHVLALLFQRTKTGLKTMVGLTGIQLSRSGGRGLRKMDWLEEQAAANIRWYDMTWTSWYDDKDETDGTYANTEAHISCWAIPLYVDTTLHMLMGLIVAWAHPDSGSDLAGSKTLYRRIGCFKNLQWGGSAKKRRLMTLFLKNKEVALQDIEII